MVILLVITIGFYDCLSNYYCNYDCLCCVVCCTAIVLLIDCYMTATKLQILLPLLLSSLLPAGSYTFNLFLPLCVWLCMQLATRLVLLKTCKHIVNMMVITMCLVFTITKVIVKLLHYNGLYKTKCKLFKVTYCTYSTPQSCTATYSHSQADQSSIKAPHHTYGSPLGSGKAASKTRPLKSG